MDLPSSRRGTVPCRSFLITLLLTCSGGCLDSPEPQPDGPTPEPTPDVPPDFPPTPTPEPTPEPTPPPLRRWVDLPGSPTDMEPGHALLYGLGEEAVPVDMVLVQENLKSQVTYRYFGGTFRADVDGKRACEILQPLGTNRYMGAPEELGPLEFAALDMVFEPSVWTLVGHNMEPADIDELPSGARRGTMHFFGNVRWDRPDADGGNCHVPSSCRITCNFPPVEGGGPILDRAFWDVDLHLNYDLGSPPVARRRCLDDCAVEMTDLDIVGFVGRMVPCPLLLGEK